MTGYREREANGLWQMGLTLEPEKRAEASAALFAETKVFLLVLERLVTRKYGERLPREKAVGCFTPM